MKVNYNCLDVDTNKIKNKIIIHVYLLPLLLNLQGFFFKPIWLLCLVFDTTYFLNYLSYALTKYDNTYVSFSYN